MKKKLLIMLLSLSVLAGITACGGESKEETPEPENKEEVVDVPDEPEASVYFKDDVLKIDMATIKLTGFEVAPPNQDFGEEKSTLILTYEFTNDSDEALQPGTVWIACFEATHTDMNNMSFTDVKPGATVQSVISYNINDTTKPITLKATQGVGGQDLGEKVYNLE